LGPGRACPRYVPRSDARDAGLAGTFGFPNRHTRLGLGPRVPGRPHDLCGVVRQVPRARRATGPEEDRAGLDRARPPAGDVRVRTERECRSLETKRVGQYSVSIVQAGRPEERRWPDLVLDGASRRSALEFERTAKGATRLQAIVDAYATATSFDEVLFLTDDVSIARRLARAVANAGRPLPSSLIAQTATPTLRVVPWPGLSAETQQAIAEVLAA